MAWSIGLLLAFLILALVLLVMPVELRQRLFRRRRLPAEDRPAQEEEGPRRTGRGDDRPAGEREAARIEERPAGEDRKGWRTVWVGRQPDQEEGKGRPAAPALARPSWGERIWRRLQAGLRTSTPMEGRQPAPERERAGRPDQAEFRVGLILLVAVVLGGVLLFSWYLEQHFAPVRPHRLTILLADLAVDEKMRGSRTGARASDDLRTYLQQELDAAGLGGMVELRSLHETPSDASAAYDLVRENRADMLLWGWVQETDPPHYFLQLAMNPRQDREVPELGEYLQVMLTPANFPLTQAGEGEGIPRDRLSTTLTWLARFYLGEFERIEGDLPKTVPPGQAPNVLVFHQAGLLWLKGEYKLSQAIYDALLDQAFVVVVGEATPPPCPPPSEPSWCAALFNNEATVLITREALGELPPGALDEALSLLTRAAQVQDSTIVRYNLGRAFLTRGKGVDAVNHLKEVVQREPERGPALAALSQAYLAMGDMGRAKETAERAIRQDRTLASAELAMGRYLSAAGDLKAAGRTFDRALKLGEAETSRRRSREASLRGGPRPSPARADYTRAWAWRNNPELAQVHLARAGLFLVTSEREGKPSFFRWLWRVLVKEPSPMDQSRAELDAALALHPNWLAALRVQAGLLISQGALDQAAETLKKLEDQDPKDVQTYMDLAQLRRRQWKMLHDAQKEEEAQKKLELARAEYRLLVERGVAPAQGYYGLGEIARDIQDWATALAEYQRAVQVDSGYAEAWLRMGQVNVVLGDEGPALEHFARAIETAGWRGGVRVDAHTERGTIFLEQYLRGKDQVPPPQQRLGDARNEFQAAVQVYANATGALAGLGRVAFEEGDYGTAERFFQQAVQLNKWDFGGLYGLGRIYEAREQSATAMKYLERAVGVYYNSIAAHYHLGAAYYAQLNESKARAEFEWVKSHCPDLAGQGRLKYDDRESCLEVEGWLKRLSSGSP